MARYTLWAQRRSSGQWSRVATLPDRQRDLASMQALTEQMVIAHGVDFHYELHDAAWRPTER